MKEGDVAMEQLYEEIKDPVWLISQSTPSTNDPQYEGMIPAGTKALDVNIAGRDTKSNNAYQITQCSAYGISLTK